MRGNVYKNGTRERPPLQHIHEVTSRIRKRRHEPIHPACIRFVLIQNTCMGVLVQLILSQRLVVFYYYMEGRERV